MVGGIGDDRARRGTEPEGSPDQTRLYRPWTLLYLCTNRYYYYNNSSTRSRQRWAVWRMGSFQARRGTVAIACQHCTCRFCSLLCCHCILLRRFDNSFYLRPGRCQGLGLFVCHLRRLSHFPPQSPVRSPQFPGGWAKLKPAVQFSMAQQFFFPPNGDVSAPCPSSSSSPSLFSPGLAFFLPPKS